MTHEWNYVMIPYDEEVEIIVIVYVMWPMVFSTSLAFIPGMELTSSIIPALTPDLT